MIIKIMIIIIIVVIGEFNILDCVQFPAVTKLLSSVTKLLLSSLENTFPLFLCEYNKYIFVITPFISLNIQHYFFEKCLKIKYQKRVLPFLLFRVFQRVVSVAPWHRWTETGSKLNLWIFQITNQTFKGAPFPPMSNFRPSSKYPKRKSTLNPSLPLTQYRFWNVQVWGWVPFKTWAKLRQCQGPPTSGHPTAPKIPERKIQIGKKYITCDIHHLWYSSQPISQSDSEQWQLFFIDDQCCGVAQQGRFKCGVSS